MITTASNIAKNRSIFFAQAAVFILFIFFVSSAAAQSILEYSTLAGETGAAGAASSGKNKGKQVENTPAGAASGVVTGAVNKLYGESAGVMAKGSELLSQAGGGALRLDKVASKSTVSRETPVKAKIVEFKGEKNEPGKPQETKSSDIMVRVNLLDGSSIEGTLIERTDAYVRINIAGAPMTYFADQITSIEQIQS